MKILSQITLTQFKNYEYQQWDINQPIVAITGVNGSGKTNLLDAIYYLCFTKSYFQSKEINNVQQGKDGFRIVGKFIDSEKNLNTIIGIYRDSKKTFEENGFVYEKLNHHIGKYIALMIAPDDIKIINEGGEYRRKFFDGLLSQTDEQYLNNLLQYQKILQQKNAYLKTILSNSMAEPSIIEYYNNLLVPAAQYISSKRKKITDEINLFVQEFYHKISDNKEQILITYQSNIVNIQHWGEQLKKDFRNECLAKRCISGIHLDDWYFQLNNLTFKTQASQGQKKSLIISLKLAQISLFQLQNKAPILLLDDIFEKLDKVRINKLFQELSKLNIAQIFLTHTDENDIIPIIQNHYNNIQIIRL